MNVPTNSSTTSRQPRGPARRPRRPDLPRTKVVAKQNQRKVPDPMSQVPLLERLLKHHTRRGCVGPLTCPKCAVQPSQVKPVPKHCMCAQSLGASSTTLCNSIVETTIVSPHIFALEIYAGTARLTASLRALGLVDSDGIDSVLPRRLNGPIIKLDLFNPSHLEHVESLTRNKACLCPLRTPMQHCQEGQAYSKQ